MNLLLNMKKKLVSSDETSSSSDKEVENDVNNLPPPPVANDHETREHYDVYQNRNWRKKKKVQLDGAFDLPQGPVLDHFADCRNEGDYFLKFIDAEIREKILFQTNLYINQKTRRIPSVTERELYSFLGINILMGYHTFTITDILLE